MSAQVSPTGSQPAPARPVTAPRVVELSFVVAFGVAADEFIHSNPAVPLGGAA